MNFKRKKKHNTKILKRKQLKSKSLQGWSYGGAVAKEIASRQEFKKEMGL